MRHMLLAAALCLAGAVLFGFLAHHSTRFEREGVPGQATVSGKIQKQTDRGIFYALEVKYAVNGATYERMRGVTPDWFERIGRGDQVDIVYVPDDPGSFIFMGDPLHAASSRNRGFAWGLGGVLLFAALALVRSAWRVRGSPGAGAVTPYDLSPPDR